MDARSCSLQSATWVFAYRPERDEPKAEANPRISTISVHDEPIPRKKPFSTLASITFCSSPATRSNRGLRWTLPPPISSCLRNGRRLKIQKARGSFYPRNGKPIMPQETGRFASRKWETVRPNPPGIPPSFGPLHSNPPDIPPSHGLLQHPARRQAAPTLLRTWWADSLPDFPRPGFSQKPHRLDCRIRLAADRLLRRASGRSEQAGTSR